MFPDLETVWMNESGWFLQYSYRNADVVDLSWNAIHAILNGSKSYYATS